MARTVDAAERLAVGFVAALRHDGIDIPVGATLRFHEALATIDLATRAEVYWAGRATLVHDPDLFGVYDRVFALFWLGGVTSVPMELIREEEVLLALEDEDAAGADEPVHEAEDDDRPVIAVRWSRHETLGSKDFAEYDDDELAEAHRLMRAMGVLGGHRSSRRQVPIHHGRGRLDLGRTVQAALRVGGEPIERRHTRAGSRPRKVVFLLDVSGSMEVYSRALVRFAQAAVAGHRRLEVFTLGTRLTRVTRELSGRDPDLALAAAGEAVTDWSGGTRLGETLRVFNDEWGQRGAARGAKVVILSDGWDRGEPDMLAEQMARLGRLAHEIIWVNPLKASEGYEPLAQGMAAALPHVTHFVEGHNLDALEELATALA